MKIGITGHTSGIGKAIYNRLRISHSIVGFAIDNDYNIDDDSSRKKIIHESQDTDVFINCAHEEWAQVKLLYDLYSIWQHKKKIIVNVNSIVGDSLVPKVSSYQIQKKALDNACKQLQPLGKCKVINIRLGLVDTPSVSNWVAEVKRIFKDKYKVLTPEKVAEIVEYTINQPDNVCVKEISIQPWPVYKLTQAFNPLAVPWLD